MKRLPLMLFLVMTVLAVAQAEPAALLNSEWQLLEIRSGDSGASRIAEPESYTVQFDQDGRAYVRADCNRGSGSYTISGAELRISELSSTLALCPPDSHYDAYMAALNDTATYEFDGERLILHATGGTSLLFAAAAEEESEMGSFGAQLRNATYLSRAAGREVTLTNGMFEDPDARVAVTLAGVTYGDLNGDGLPDALVQLDSNTGASGMFVELVAVLNEAGTPQQAGSVLLGDRVKVQGISSAGSLVRLTMVTQGPGEPQCCPTMQVTQHYLFSANGLYQLPRDSFTDALFNATYPSDHAPGGSVTLVDGRATAGTEMGMTFTLARVAFGDLNRDGRTDSAVIIRSETPHGVFHELHAVENQASELEVIASESLGEDITLYSLRVEGGLLLAEFAPAGEADAVLTRTYGLGATPLFLLDEQER